MAEFHLATSPGTVTGNEYSSSPAWINACRGSYLWINMTTSVSWMILRHITSYCVIHQYTDQSNTCWSRITIRVNNDKHGYWMILIYLSVYRFLDLTTTLASGQQTSTSSTGSWLHQFGNPWVFDTPGLWIAGVPAGTRCCSQIQQDMSRHVKTHGTDWSVMVVQLEAKPEGCYPGNMEGISSINSCHKEIRNVLKYVLSPACKRNNDRNQQAHKIIIK